MKHVSQLSVLGESVLVWRDDLPGVADVTKFAVELNEQDLKQLINDIRREQLGTDLTGEL